MGTYRQFSNVQNLGDKKYFPLRISRLTRQGTGDRDVVRVYERYIFLTSYEETYEANWSIPDTPLGRLNTKYDYSQTTRKATMTFKLGARNVEEARSNLDFCSAMANLVYGDYYRRGNDFVYNGANVNNKIKFGNLIRNELCYFENFNFAPNMDAGVYEFNGSPNSEGIPIGLSQDVEFANDSGLLEETGYVYHFDKGKVYPKEVEVTLSLIFVHDYPLGFGGPSRSREHQLRWAQNTGRDWPHGTGPVGVMRYMQASATPAQESVYTDADGNEVSLEELEARYQNYRLGPDGISILPE